MNYYRITVFDFDQIIEMAARFAMPEI